MAGWNDLQGILTMRPLESPLPRDRTEVSRFKARMGQTAELLAREIDHLHPRQAILEVDLEERHIRLDGFPYAHARFNSSGVRLTLIGTPHGDLRYPCNSFTTAEDNLRAIALALEALRKVDRYGVTKRGEQYAGWKQLESGSKARGEELIEQHGSVAAALKATHPDHGGDVDDFRAVQEAR